MIALTTPRTKIRTLDPSDAEGYATLGVSYRSTGPLDTPEKARRFLEKAQTEDSDIHLGIFVDEETLVGTIELCHFNWFDNQACEISYTIHADHRRQGLATEALSKVIEYCFDTLEHHTIFADTDEDNEASQRLLEKLGFTLEGRIRDRRRINGEWKDELDYGLLRTEWHASMTQH